MLRLARWGWPIKFMTENIRTIAAGSLKILEQIAETLLR